MPDSDSGQEAWEPKRGPVFKAVVWVLLVLIAVGALGAVVIGLVS
jgi:hypothetical protein